MPSAPPVIEFHGATLGYGHRRLWSELDLVVRRGEFLAVLGANGSGKTSLLRTILGVQSLTAGTLEVMGQPVRRGNAKIGYIPQQRRFDPLTPLRARDLVRQGLDGHRWGFSRPGRIDWRRITDALDTVEAAHLADVPVGLLSGGEQQRVRVAQALVAERELLLCDEPMLSLDLAGQATVTERIDQARHDTGTAVVFVTHEINPVLDHVDRVLYLAGGRFRIGAVDAVLNSATLSDLYGAPVEVLRVGERILVVGAPGHVHHSHDDDEVET
ncbi:MAG TPA: ABC transporter ATP-binding protein [Acidimicrobiales bacterium]|nr:ABC transporter ATP-binding protein [Acidimicrobiales bacterium]